MGPKWTAYQKALGRTKETASWLSHVGKTGRTTINGNTDRLSLSRAHASVKLCIAGQYDEGGTNYRDSPEAFNKALINIIHDDFASVSARILDRLKSEEAAALIEARAEVEAALASINEAESDAAVEPAPIEEAA